jgi:hypothetical protein
MPEIAEEPLASLVRRYASAAPAHGRATEAGDSERANGAARSIAAIYSELRRRGIAAQRELLPLLHDLSPGVRAWAGAHALEFAPDVGEQALTVLSQMPGSLVGFSANITLLEWRAGRLRFS